MKSEDAEALCDSEVGTLDFIATLVGYNAEEVCVDLTSQPHHMLIPSEHQSLHCINLYSSKLMTR